MAAHVLFASTSAVSSFQFHGRLGQGVSVARPATNVSLQFGLGHRGIMGKVQAFQVTFKTPTGDEVVEVDDDTYLLDAAEEAGVELPYSCRAGACSSCAAVLVSGDVDQSDQSFLDDDQIAGGFVLTCTAYAKSDLVLETHAEDKLVA